MQPCEQSAENKTKRYPLKDKQLMLSLYNFSKENIRVVFSLQELMSTS